MGLFFSLLDKEDFLKCEAIATQNTIGLVSSDLGFIDV